MNKIGKRISAIALSAIMLLSISAAADDEAAATNAEAVFTPLCSEAYDALSAMDLLTKDLKEADANAHITRAQFIGNLCRLAGYDAATATTADIPFIDVNEQTPHKDEICTFYNLGFVRGTGDGVFSPNDEITYEQAVKLVIDVLGYREYTAAKYGAYPQGYIAAAQRLELTKHLKTGNTQDPITADTAVQLLYNAARTSVAEAAEFSSTGGAIYKTDEDRELLSVNHSIYYDEGTVQSNGIVTYLSRTVGENIAVIDGRDYIMADSADLSRLLGCKVKFFYRYEKNGNNVLLYARVMPNNDILEISADSLLPDDPLYKGTNIVYLKDGKRTDIELDRYADIFRNNMICNDYAVLKPSAGTLRFIDNDSDGKQDVVIIEEFENIFVSSVSIVGEFIGDRFGNTLFLDEYDNVKISDGGKEISLENVRSGCVVSYVASNDKKYVYVYVNPVGRTDTLLYTGEENARAVYSFSNTEYNSSSSFEKLKSNGEYLICDARPGKGYTYWLDMAGNVAYMEESDESRPMYAYLINAAAHSKATGGANKAELKLLLETGETITAVTEKKITLNGISDKTGADFLALGDLYADGEIKEQVIRLELNGDGNISMLELAAECTSEYGYDNTGFTRDYSGNLKFNSKASYMMSYKYTVGSDTIIFAKYKDLDSDDAYVVAKPGSIETDNSHNMVLYDCDETLVPKVISVEMTSDTMYEQRIVLVDKTRYAADKNGATCMQVSGYSFGRAVTYTEMYEGTFPKDLKRGDVLKIAQYRDRVLRAEKLCSLKDDKTPFINGYGTVYCTIFGEVYSVGANGILTLNPTGHENGYLTATSFKGKTYLTVQIYDSVNNTVSVGTLADLVQTAEPAADGTLAANDNNTRVLLLRRNEYLLDAVIVYY